MSVKEVKTIEEFNEVIATNKIVAVDMWAAWCGPCRQYSPVFEKVSETTENIAFVKVNVDEVNEIAAEYNVVSIPTTLIIKDGKVSNRIVGSVSPSVLRNELSKFE